MPQSKDYQTYFSEELALIERALEQSLPQPTPPAIKLHEAMRYAMIPGGKRIRPLLVLCVVKTLGAAWEQAMPAAVALELLHGYTLIHDDLPCMDDDVLRRGQPTVHIAFGEATALLAGDALLTLAFEQAVQSAHDPVRIVSSLAQAAGANGVIAGQVADLQAVEQDVVSAEQLDFIHSNKTAALFCAAAVMGVYAAGKGNESELVQTFTTFGFALGMAFQYIDDLLDAGTETAFSSVKVLGEAEVRARADQYTNKALQTLEAYGPEADSLRQLTQFMLQRET